MFWWIRHDFAPIDEASNPSPAQSDPDPLRDPRAGIEFHIRRSKKHILANQCPGRSHPIPLNVSDLGMGQNPGT